MTQIAFTLRQLAAELRELVVETFGNLDVALTDATDDSRKVKPGSLFCAIKGERFDGHDFIQQAVERGAAAVLAAKPPAANTKKLPAIIVSNDYRAAAIAAELAAGKPAQHFKTFAITGTNGKTTSAYLLRNILNTAGFNTAMFGTVEYDLGNGTVCSADRTTPTPFSLQILFSKLYNSNVRYCVMELSSHALYQQRLGNLKVDGAIFTNLTQDHLDYHVSLENYYQAKKRLFTKHLKPGAPAVINVDDPFGKRLADELAYDPAKVQVISFSLKNLCAPVCVHVKDLKLTANGTECALSYPNDDWLVTSPLAGLYNGYNIAGVAILAHALGLPNPTVKQALATCLPPPGRFQKINSKRNVHAFVDYAHTPDALQNVLATLRTLIRGNIIAVFGCGGDRDSTKRPLMAKAVQKHADVIIVTSDNPRSENPDQIIKDIVRGFDSSTHFHVQPDRRMAIQLAVQLAQPEDAILLAGKGHEDYQEINGVKYPFSDAQVLAECLQ